MTFIVLRHRILKALCKERKKKSYTCFYTVLSLFSAFLLNVSKFLENLNSIFLMLQNICIPLCIVILIFSAVFAFLFFFFGRFLELRAFIFCFIALVVPNSQLFKNLKLLNEYLKTFRRFGPMDWSRQRRISLYT